MIEQLTNLVPPFQNKKDLIIRLGSMESAFWNLLQKKTIKCLDKGWVKYGLQITLHLRVTYKNQKPHMGGNQFEMVI